MILGIGTDIVEISRIKELYLKFGEKFFERFFTQYENQKALEFDDEGENSRRIKYYAKRFAAKEAFSKSCGTGIGRGVNFLDIEVRNNDLGKPYINLLNMKKEHLSEVFGSNFEIFLSLSDEKEMAVATVVIEKNS